MPTRMFVNLPVKDLRRSVDFFTTLGYKFNPQFTDENATCMIVGEDSSVMLQWGFADLDGHIWEYFWIGPSAIQGQEDQPGTGR